MTKFIKKIIIVTDEGEYGENVFIFDKDKNLIEGYSNNDLHMTEYIEGLLESLGHEVEYAELIDMFDSEEEKREWELDHHGYNAYDDGEED